MSLVGSLEDLGLGDILQIVSLSRKSGILKLNSPGEEGRIILREGKVCAATVKGEPEDLRSVLVGGRFLDEAEFDGAVNRSRRTGMLLETALCECAALTSEKIEALRREHVQRAVLMMFSWSYGEFSFEVGGEIDDREAELLLDKGMNAEFFAIEATRLGDERAGEGASPGFERAPREEYDGGEITFSGEVIAPDFSDAHEAIGLAVAQKVEAELDVMGETDLSANFFSAAPVEFVPAARPGAAPNEPTEVSRANPTTQGPSAVRLIAIDSNLDALEWLKSELAGLFSRIHIFQKSDDGVARVQQYLGRGETPVVLISANTACAGASVPGGLESLGGRLRALAPRMPILVTAEENGPTLRSLASKFANGVVGLPRASNLANRSRWSNLENEGKALWALLASWVEALEAGEAQAPVSPLAQPAAATLDLSALVEVSAKLRNPTGIDVMSLVLDFASRVFSRVVIFVVRDDVAVGLGQRGLEESGGPCDEELAELRIPVVEVESFRVALAERKPVRALRSGVESCPLAALLGPIQPRDVFIAPIESGGGIAALLYGDTVVGDAPMGDTSTVEVVLHQAGLALDLALLHRALAEA